MDVIRVVNGSACGQPSMEWNGTGTGLPQAKALVDLGSGLLGPGLKADPDLMGDPGATGDASTSRLWTALGLNGTGVYAVCWSLR